MACGDRYKSLLVLANGNTADYPWGDAWYSVPTFFDYEQWRSKATEIALMANSHWKRLEAVEIERGTQEKRQALIAEHDGLVDQVRGLPGTLEAMFGVDEVSWGPAIDRAVASARAGTCVLEQIDDAIASYGVAAPKIPVGNTPTEERPGSGGGGKFDSALVVALALGGFGVWMWTRKAKA